MKTFFINLISVQFEKQNLFTRIDGVMPL